MWEIRESRRQGGCCGFAVPAARCWVGGQAAAAGSPDVPQVGPPWPRCPGRPAAVQLRSAYPRFAGLPACYAECLLLTHSLPAAVPPMQ